ncbi:MAG: hypothetical protein IKX43_08225 [Paludibacteraceae bacterium]|nr:hypothetical protein [Paludibacteraceae bacterium]
MITATIGKIFLEAYNRKYGTKYDAKTFFVEVYHPLFFDQEKYLMTAGNTPLENPKISWADMISGKKPFETKEKRKQRFENFLKKFEIGYPTTDNSVGFGSTDVNSTTSGQTTNIQYPFTEDDIYTSWFGAGLGIGIQGGFSILIPNKEILMDLFEGWKLYRSAVNENQKLKGNQVNTWNGQWLAHRYSKDFRQEQPMADFTPFETTNDGMSVATQSWTKVLIGISRQFDNPKMMGYVYNLGQTNTTIGFIPFSLEHIRRPIQLYAKLFDAEEGKKAEDLWGTESGFRACCQRGAIGIEAMQPKGLRQYMKAEKDKTVRLPKYDDKQVINFHTYQIWLLAMLNNEELWTKSIEFAQMLQEYVNKDKKLSTKRGNLVKTILASTSKRAILSALSEIISDVEAFNEIEENAKIIHLMPTDNVPYYLTLIRFHYAGMSNKNNH